MMVRIVDGGDDAVVWMEVLVVLVVVMDEKIELG